MRQGIIPFAVLLTSLTITAAQPWNWALDPRCGDGQGSYGEGIEKAMIQALNRADISVQWMTAAQGDRNSLVHNLFETIIGGNRRDNDYDAKFNRVLDRFRGVSQYNRNQSPQKATTAHWVALRGLRDLEFWCSADSDRYEIRTYGGAQHWWNKNVQTWDINHDQIASVVTGQTRTSALTCRFETNIVQQGQVVGLQEVTHATINVNPAWMDIWKRFGWPVVDQAWVELIRDPHRRAGIEAASRQWANFPPNVFFPLIDLVATLDHTIFHEMMHTASAGFPRAYDQPPGRCYGWICVLDIKDELNADSLAYLALCVQLLSINYYCEVNGNLTPL